MGACGVNPELLNFENTLFEMIRLGFLKLKF